MDVVGTTRSRLLAAGGVSLAVLVAVMSLVGLFDPALYARETPAWRAQARAQDWFDLAVAAPALVGAALAASQGRLRSLVVFAGVLLFWVYTAVIYAFAVHHNALFLVYCAALGLGAYLLIGVVVRLFGGLTRLPLDRRAPHRLAGGFLVATGVAFTLLWLSTLVPALLRGEPPDDLAATGLLTNPVHVIDLSFILPLHVIAGLALWRRSRWLLLGPIVLVFDVAMTASIALLALSTGQAPVAIVMLVLTVASAALGYFTGVARTRV